MQDKKWVLIFLIFLSLIGSDLGAEDLFKGPFAASKPSKKLESSVTSAAAWVGLLAIDFFKGVISPADGPKSPSYPTGSSYGRQAVSKHGLVLGAILTADRLFHEADKPLGPIIRLNNRNRFYDPVENNTFWWDQQGIKSNKQSKIQPSPLLVD